MRIINLDLNRKNTVNLPMCACIGYFDGVHKGHKALIDKTIQLANEKNCSSALITFDKDPWEVIHNQSGIKHISTFRQRINMAVSYGIKNIVILHFTKEMSELSPTDFIDKVLGQLDLRALVCGFDFHYGYHGEGDSTSLKKDAAYEVIVLDAVEDEEGKISSTRISKEVEKGNFPIVSKMLGYHFTIEGIVKSGNQQGTKIGFPTANIEINEEYILPPMGVYAGYARIGGKRYEAMINLGHNPTMNYSQKLSLEVHLLNYHDDIYGKLVSVEFVQFIRNEIKFKNRDNLIMQLEQDARVIHRLLNT